MSARGEGPALLRLTVPRLQGHSFQDTQTYKSEDFVASEWARDPLPKLKAHLVGAMHGREPNGTRSQREAEAAVERGARRGRSARRRRSGNGDATTSSTKARCSSAAASGPAATSAPRVDRDAAARRPAHQHGHGDPPHARSRAGDQSARAAVRRGYRPEGRRPCGDPGPAGQVRRSSGCSTPAFRRKALSAAPSAWRWPG